MFFFFYIIDHFHMTLITMIHNVCHLSQNRRAWVKQEAAFQSP